MNPNTILPNKSMPFLVSLFLGVIVMFWPAAGAGQGTRIDLNLSGDRTLSASIRNASIKRVVERFEGDLGIWVKGSERVSETLVTLEFEDLPLADGLDRILSGTNYSLIFDREDNILGVILLGSAQAAPQRRPPRRAPPRSRRIPRRMPRQ